MSYKVVYQDIGFRDYKETWEYQEKIFNELAKNKLSKLHGSLFAGSDDYGTLIFVEHPHVYTLGKHGSENNLLIDHIQLQAKDASFYRTNRGGDITYHGPGQIVGYPIFDLEVIKVGLREYINRLEEAVIMTIADYGITGSRLKNTPGVWINPGIPEKERKICAIGVRASRYITMHGFAFNVNTNLAYFNYINPCGFVDKRVTSIEKELGQTQDFENIKLNVKDKLRKVFDLVWINPE